MRFTIGLAALLLSLGTAACSRPVEPERHDSAARKVGHVAYGAAQESKDVAKKAGHELKEAGREFHQGWKEARQESRDKKSR